MNKTKIVCTIGPAINSINKFCNLIYAGMGVARFNFSHGTHVSHFEKLNQLREAIKKTKTPIALMLDTKGPETRLGAFIEKEIFLKEGDIFILTTRNVIGNSTKVSVSNKELTKLVSKGTKIILNDGNITLLVEQVLSEDIVCRILNSGFVMSSIRINIPSIEKNLNSLTSQDKEDIKFAIHNGFDFIAASFIRTKEDVLEMRQFLDENDGEDIKIVSKIENKNGLDNIDEIISISDGIMISRGDLGVEIPFEEVPVVQKLVCEKANKQNTMVIIATQLLDSMVKNQKPTRAEASDVANCVYDGADAIILSSETATGLYPIETVSTMKKIILKSENCLYGDAFPDDDSELEAMDIANAISLSAVTVAKNLTAKHILCITSSGRTASYIAKYKPNCMIYAITSNPKIRNQLLLKWGVHPVLMDGNENINVSINRHIKACVSNGLLNYGDVIVLTCGELEMEKGTTNLLKIHVVNNHE